MLVYQAQHVGLSEAHRNVPDHNRREAFLTVQNTIKVYLVAFWGILSLTYHHSHVFAFSSWSRHKPLSRRSVCLVARLILRRGHLHVHEPLLEIHHFVGLALLTAKLLWIESLKGGLLREGALKLLRLLLILLGEVGEIHCVLGKLLEPLEHFLLVLHLGQHRVLLLLITLVVHFVGGKLIALRNTLIGELVVVARILVETHLHLLEEKLLLRLHFLLVLHEGAHHC